MRRGGYLRAVEARVEGIVGAVLVREHPWWSPALLGRPVELGHGMAWLDPSRADAVAAGAGRIRLVEGDLASVLDGLDAGSLDAVTASNVPDWLDAAETGRLADSLARALRPGGRLLVRCVLPDGGLPSDGRFVRDPRSDGFTAAERTAPLRSGRPAPPRLGAGPGPRLRPRAARSDDPPIHEIQADPAEPVGKHAIRS